MALCLAACADRVEQDKEALETLLDGFAEYVVDEFTRVNNEILECLHTIAAAQRNPTPITETLDLQAILEQAEQHWAEQEEEALAWVDKVSAHTKVMTMKSYALPDAQSVVKVYAEEHRHMYKQTVAAFQKLSHQLCFQASVGS